MTHLRFLEEGGGEYSPTRPTAAEPFHTVMAGHSRSKNGVASHAYVPTIHVFLAKTWMPGTRPGMTTSRARHPHANV